MSETLAKISLRSFGVFFLMIVLLVTFVSCVVYPADGYSETDGVYYDPSTDTLPLGYGSYENGVGDYYQYGQNGNGNVYPGIIEKNKMNTEERKRRFSGIYGSKNPSTTTNWGRYAGNDVYYTSYGYGWGLGMGPFWWSHDPFYYGWGYNPYWIFGLSWGWGWDYPWYSGFYYPYGYGGYYGSHYGRGYGHNYLYSGAGRLNGYNTPNPHSPNGYINRNQNSYNGDFGSGKRNEGNRYNSRYNYYNNDYRGGMKIPDSRRYYGADGENMRSSGYNDSSGWGGNNNGAGGFHNSNSGGFRGGSSSGGFGGGSPGGGFSGGGFSGGPSGGGFHGN